MKIGAAVLWLAMVEDGLIENDIELPAPDAETIKLFLDHAERCWSAERENAERLSKERHLLITVTIGLLGIGLFRFDWVGHMIEDGGFAPPIVVTINSFLLFASLFLLGWSLYGAARGSGRSLAARLLKLEAESIENLHSFSPLEAQIKTFLKTHDAFIDLSEQNEAKRRRMRRAGTKFLLALFCASITVVIYMIVLNWSMYTEQTKGVDHGGEQRNEIQSQSATLKFEVDLSRSSEGNPKGK